MLLLKTLQSLGDEEFRGFKWHLENTAIPKCQLEPADRYRTVDLMVQHFPQEAVNVTITFLRSINRNDLVETLSQNNAEGKSLFRPVWKCSDSLTSLNITTKI